MNVKENELTRFVNNLYEQGCRKVDDISGFDLENIVGLIIQATPPFLQPSANDIDNRTMLLDKIGAYLISQEVEDLARIAEYLSASCIDYFLPTVQLLLDRTHDRSIAITGIDAIIASNHKLAK